MTKWRHVCKAGTLHFHFMGEYSDRVKTMGTHGKIYAIWWNIKINLQKLLDICGYELSTNLKKFVQKYLTKVKIFQNVLGGYFFETPSVFSFILTNVCNSNEIADMDQLDDADWTIFCLNYDQQMWKVDRWTTSMSWDSSTFTGATWILLVLSMSSMTKSSRPRCVWLSVSLYFICRD